VYYLLLAALYEYEFESLSLSRTQTEGFYALHPVVNTESKFLYRRTTRDILAAMLSRIYQQNVTTTPRNMLDKQAEHFEYVSKNRYSQ
jgi:hypothetical protein